MRFKPTPEKLFILRRDNGDIVRHPQTGEPYYFSSKFAAREMRSHDEVVSAGPDHKRYKPRKGDKL